jgi:hypothetical protein
MTKIERKRAEMRINLERLIRADRVAMGRDVSHLEFGRSSVAAELAHENILRHIERVTARTWLRAV